MPDWVHVKEVKSVIIKSISNLSHSDLSVLNLALELKCQLASDDLAIRIVARQHEISVTGSVGIMKALYLTKIITDKERYLSHVRELSRDVYLSDDLINWALDVE